MLYSSRPEFQNVQSGELQKQIELISDELLFWLDDSERSSIKKMKKEDLILLHSTLGRDIRNEYELWIEGHHITEIWRASDDDSGNHPCHPDNVSQASIVRLWQKLNKA